MVNTRTTEAGIDELKSQMTLVQAGLEKMTTELASLNTRIDDRVKLATQGMESQMTTLTVLLEKARSDTQSGPATPEMPSGVLLKRVLSINH